MRIGRLTRQKSFFMAPELSAYLQDILDACIAMEDVIVGVTLDDYRYDSTF
jgi:hypothetical protein